MNNVPHITPEIQAARSVSEMLAAVAPLRQVDGVEAISHLARFHQRAPGWLIVLFSGAARLIFGLTLIAALLLLTTAVARFLFELNRELLTRLYPGWETVWTAALLGLTAVILYRSAGARELWRYRPDYLTAVVPLPARLRPALHGALRLLEGVVQAAMILVVAALLTTTLNPFLILLFNLGDLFHGFWLTRAEIAAWFVYHWAPSLMSLLLIILFILWLRRAERETLIHANLLIWGAASLVDWGATLRRTDPAWFNERVGAAVESIWLRLTTAVPLLNDDIRRGYELTQESVQAAPWEIGLLFMGFLFLLYPIGGAVGLAQRFYYPYAIGQQAFNWLATRWRLRWQIRQALGYHGQRNRALIDNDGWAAVCRIHFRRCQSYKERLGYRRTISYACCPVCHSDNALYTGVQCVALYFDRRVNEAALQKEGTLLLNGLSWLKGGGQPPIIDALVIGEADPHDVELGIALYLEKMDPARHKPLEQVSGRIVTGVEPLANTRRILQENLLRVMDDYDPESSPTACTQSVRLRETVDYRQRRLRLALRKTARAAVVLAAILALAFWGPTVWERAPGWWETFRQENVMPHFTTPTPMPTPTATPTVTPTARPLFPTPTVTPQPSNVLRPYGEAIQNGMICITNDCNSSYNSAKTKLSKNWQKNG